MNLRMYHTRLSVIVAAVLTMLFVFPTSLWADPCGMVPPPPPPYLSKTTLIERVGAQKTYVFYKNGVESFVIRPGFKGKVEKFGMLIPFPSPPALRKVPNSIFSHITAAIDPPEVVVRLTRRRWRIPRSTAAARGASAAPAKRAADDLAIQSVRVLKQEAVGMYQVAVLEAGSAKALARWMKDNGFRYPKGMDKVVQEYVNARWCFVAVKARVAGKQGVAARPGMRAAKAAFPKGGTFTGKVQAMGFRFRTRRLVVPMRLSAFNKGKLRNIVYLLTDRPKRIRHIPSKYVVRQLKGKDLYRNVMSPLPLRIIGGTEKSVPRWRWRQLHRMRVPTPHNGHAKDLFASDLLAARTRKLSLKHEEKKKVLLRIEERLNLRDDRIDKINQDILGKQRSEIVKRAIRDLRSMTMTVVDGDFPRKVLARENLTFATYRMPSRCNQAAFYHARTLARQKCRPMPIRRNGKIFLGKGPGYNKWMRKQRRKRPKTGRRPRGGRYYYRLIRRLSNAKTVNRTIKKLVRAGNKALPFLVGEMIEGNKWERRGWSVVALSDIGGEKAKQELTKIYQNTKHHVLMRYLTAAARIKLATTVKELMPFTRWMPGLPALDRPFRMKGLALLRRDKKNYARNLFLLAGSNNAVQVALRPAIQALSSRQMLDAMLRCNTNRARVVAASFASQKVAKSPKKTLSMLFRMLRFKRNANKVPWGIGALYMPQFPRRGLPQFNQWTWRNRLSSLARSTPWMQLEQRLQKELKNMREQERTITQRQAAKRKLNQWMAKASKRFFADLWAWAIWADRRGKTQDARKVYNNLNNWHIRQHANNASVSPTSPNVKVALQQWARAKKDEEIVRILRHAGVLGRRGYSVRAIRNAKQELFNQFLKRHRGAYRGCYRLNTYNSRYSYAGYKGTLRGCTRICRKRGKPLTGIYSGGSCYCLDYIKDKWQYPYRRYRPQQYQSKVKDTFCMIPCRKNPKEFCGGSGYWAVMDNSKLP